MRAMASRRHSWSLLLRLMILPLLLPATATAAGSSPASQHEAWRILKPQRRLQQIPNPQPLPGPQPVPLPNPQPLPDPNPQPLPGPQPLPVPNPQPLPQPDPNPQPLPNPQPQPVPLPNPQPQPLPNPQPLPQPNPSPLPVPQPIPSPLPNPNSNPQPQPQPQPQPDLGTPGQPSNALVGPQPLPIGAATTTRLSHTSLVFILGFFLGMHILSF